MLTHAVVDSPATQALATELSTVDAVARCRVAVDTLAARLHAFDGDLRRKHAPDRTVSCTLLDLDLTFHGHLRDGCLVGITSEPRPRAQIRVLCLSDDLIAMVEGDLGFTQAWGSGRLRLDAGWRDLIRLSALLHR